MSPDALALLMGRLPENLRPPIATGQEDPKPRIRVKIMIIDETVPYNSLHSNDVHWDFTVEHPERSHMEIIDQIRAVAAKFLGREVARHAEEYSDEAISDVITPIKAEPLSPSQEPLTETLTLSQLTPLRAATPSKTEKTSALIPLEDHLPTAPVISKPTPRVIFSDDSTHAAFATFKSRLAQLISYHAQAIQSGGSDPYASLNKGHNHRASNNSSQLSKEPVQLALKEGMGNSVAEQKHDMTRFESLVPVCRSEKSTPEIGLERPTLGLPAHEDTSALKVKESPRTRRPMDLIDTAVKEGELAITPTIQLPKPQVTQAAQMTQTSRALLESLSWKQLAAFQNLCVPSSPKPSASAPVLHPVAAPVPSEDHSNENKNESHGYGAWGLAQPTPVRPTQPALITQNDAQSSIPSVEQRSPSPKPPTPSQPGFW